MDSCAAAKVEGSDQWLIIPLVCISFTPRFSRCSGTSILKNCFNGNNILETPSALAAWRFTFNLDRAPWKILRRLRRANQKGRCALGRKLKFHAAKADGVSSKSY